jgi:methylated-DNA-[protein]-cysteine S-methyltransferase
MRPSGAAEAMRQLHDYFAGTRTSFDLPLDLQGGTAFQQSVWQRAAGDPAGPRPATAR